MIFAKEDSPPGKLEDPQGNSPQPVNCNQERQDFPEEEKEAIANHKNTDETEISSLCA